MATQTESLGLNIWVPEDKVTMAGFNENSQILENRLGHLVTETILETTISAAAATVSIPMSGIDWSKYDYVVMDTYVSGSNTSSYLNWRVNGDSSSAAQKYKYLGSSSIQGGEKALLYTNSGLLRRRVIFTVNKEPNREIQCTFDRDYEQGWGSFSGKKYSAFSTLVITAYNSGDKVAKGGTIKIWGVKGCW